MDRTQSILATAAVAVIWYASRTSIAHCRRRPARRPWLILGATASLCAVPFFWPWVDHLSPGMRESPAGLLLIVPKLIAISLLALSAFGTLLGALLSFRRDDGANHANA